MCHRDVADAIANFLVTKGQIQTAGEIVLRPRRGSKQVNAPVLMLRLAIAMAINFIGAFVPSPG